MDDIYYDNIVTFVRTFQISDVVDLGKLNVNDELSYALTPTLQLNRVDCEKRVKQTHREKAFARKYPDLKYLASM